jgi:Nif-specific regulatory protein
VSHVTLEIRTGVRAGERVTLTPPATIGRSPDAELCLPDAHLSGEHGVLRFADGALRFVDQRSSNGTVHQRGGVHTPLIAEDTEAELWHGDTLLLGDQAQPVVLQVHLPDPALTGVLAVRPIAEVDQFADRVTGDGRRLRALYAHMRALGRTTDLNAALDVAAQLTFDLLPKATHVAVALAERAGRFPVVYAQNRAGERPAIAVSRTLMQRVLAERAGLLITNAAAELAQARSVVQAGLASTLLVPLWTGDTIRGVLQVDNRDAPGLFDASDLEALTVAAGPISFATENARLVARLTLAEAKASREAQFLKAREQAATFTGIVGDSPAMTAVADAVSKVRDTRVAVLIQGETGTGKELVARALHYTSQRRDALFVAQNCSALPDTLLESALFGHVRGAFTGADRDKKGLFELADRGTIFLDELGEMPPLLQAKLLRVLQEGEVWPIGAPRPKRVDVRVVSATHRDLDEMVQAGTFRQDLFYRLHVYPIRLPPLRERPEDIPQLARHFLRLYAKEFMRPVSGFTPEALERLCAYRWPGNIRELQNELQRILIGRTEGDLVLLEDLSARILGTVSIVDDPRIPSGSLKEMIEAVEKVLLARALRAHNNNKTRTAKALGITREGLHKKLGRFGMKS